ncbi:MAG TPA: TRAP transporter large permease [Sphaerochaeta sp.]|nr:TRAP transporter large permease [Sphaerochaeta sp.]
MNSFGVLLLFGSLALLMVLRIPIAFSLAISSIVTALYLQIPLLFIFQKMVNGLNSFTFLAVPFFILAAQIMIEGDISTKLMELANVLVGRIRGGTAMVNVVASMFFGGISGSSVADVSSIGSFLIPAMEAEGYDKDFSVAVTVTSSVQGVIIPPSQNMIYYSLAAGGLSIGKLFVAGYIPGIMLGIGLMITTYIISVKRNYPKGRKYTLKEGLFVAKDAALGLFMIVIIIGGIVAGIFTPTESAAIASAYALFITFFVYKNMTFKKLYKIFVSSTNMLLMIIAIIAASSAFGFLLAYMRIPLMVTNFFLSISDNPFIILISINVLMLVLGLVMDMGVLILLLTPILLPVAVSIGIDPIHFGIIMILNLGLGLCTPPVGTSLFVGCAIANLKIEKSIKMLLPFYLTMIILLIILIAFPQLSLWLPNKMLG